MSDDKPPEKPTVELAAPPAWAIDLTMNMKAGFAAVNGRLDTMETNLDLQGDTVRDVAKRMTAVEMRQTSYEERAGKNSLSVKKESANNLEQDAAIAAVKVETAEIKAAVEALTTKQDLQTEILTDIKRAGAQVIANPTVRKIASLLGTAIVVALTMWLTSKGVLPK